DLIIVEVRYLVQHGIHGACGFANSNHLYHHGRKNTAGSQRFGHGLTLRDGLTDTIDSLFYDLVTGGLGYDLETVHDGHTGTDHGAKRTGKLGNGNFTYKRTSNWSIQCHAVNIFFPDRCGIIFFYEPDNTIESSN